jgi:hypothetical protein
MEPMEQKAIEATLGHREHKDQKEIQAIQEHLNKEQRIYGPLYKL